MRYLKPNFVKGIVALFVLGAVLVLAGCTPSTASSTPPASTPAAISTPAATLAPTQPPAGGTFSIDLTAQNISFDKSTISVPAGAAVTINFTNKDSGVPHNFALYNDSSAAKSIFMGQIITGPATATYKFTAPTKPGTYFFRCDIHPGSMTGNFIVQ